MVADAGVGAGVPRQPPANGGINVVWTLRLRDCHVAVVSSGTQNCLLAVEVPHCLLMTISMT